MKALLFTTLLLAASSQAWAEICEINSPDQLVTCMQSYITQWASAADSQTVGQEPGSSTEFVGRTPAPIWQTESAPPTKADTATAAF